MRPTGQRNPLWAGFNYRRSIPHLGGVSVPRIILPDSSFKLHVEWSTERKRVLFIKKIR